MLSRARRRIGWLWLLPLVLSCAGPALRGEPAQESEERRIAGLEAALLALGEGVAREEAHAVASAAHAAARRLAAGGRGAARTDKRIQHAQGAHHAPYRQRFRRLD